MKAKKIDLANMHGRLSRDEMKNILGGDGKDGGGGGCLGIISCPTLEVGTLCGPVAPDCRCRQQTGGDKMCMP